MISSHLGIVSHQSGCDFDASEQVMKRHQWVNQLKKNYTFWNFSLGRDFFEKLVSFLCIRIGSRSISGTTGSVHASLFAYICNDSVSSAKPHRTFFEFFTVPGQHSIEKADKSTMKNIFGKRS